MPVWWGPEIPLLRRPDFFWDQEECAKRNTAFRAMPLGDRPQNRSVSSCGCALPVLEESRGCFTVLFKAEGVFLSNERAACKRGPDLFGFIPCGLVGRDEWC